MTKGLPNHVLPWPPVWRLIEGELAEREWTQETLYTLMGERFGMQYDGWYRVVKRAEHKGWIDLHKADQFLTLLGLSIYDLPFFNWDCEPPHARSLAGRTRRDYTAEDRVAVEADLRQGVPIRVAARKHGVPRTTVRDWKLAMEAVAA